MILEKRHWFRVIFQLNSSVIPAIFPRVAFFVILSLIVSTLFHFQIPVTLPSQTSIVSSLVLGLLLVFRTNTAYERFWEGRKLWGVFINNVRNLARELWVGIAEESPEDKTEKISTIRLLVAFAIATKLHLRNEPLDDELAELMSSERYERLKTMNNPPLEIAFWIGDYIKKQSDRDRIGMSYLLSILQLLETMVAALGGCERILKTPIPLAYSIHLKQLLVLYCLCLPSQLVREFGWSTAIIVGIISFTVFGIEEIGIEIENPFGHDPNDLPLDTICQTMKINIEDLISFAPSARYYEEQ
ncbi:MULTISPECIES: bestrophin family ion channel [Spirulina sp. CCY15215]|uniref:bestrophin family protein n=1 Tax=Spirulina sp. CCY15215 TaxID=2767591 RepID=UPI00194EB303|nr:bestrophin family ion channel [Spirulina major]